jgi:hypothetical protein
MAGISEQEFFGQFVVFAPNGTFDRKATLARFESSVIEYVKKSEEVKPIILSELRQWNGKLAEGTLVSFTLHSLKLQPNTENQDKVRKALEEMVAAGQLIHLSNKGQSGRGRGTGYALPSAKTSGTPTPQNQNAQ